MLAYSSIYLSLSLIAVMSAYGQQENTFDYKKWWNDWYSSGGNSGAGSRGLLAMHKADIINNFLASHEVRSVIEFGCGDGYNLSLINYKKYIGLDVSSAALQMCISVFKDDSTKRFILYEPSKFTTKYLPKVDLIVCLDVLHHITNEKEFNKVLDDIFVFESPYIILYTSIFDDHNSKNSPEILHRNIMPYLKKYPKYEVTIEKNKHPELTRSQWLFLTRKESCNS